MNKDRVYIQLQKHLNKQPVGFPPTLSGVEIKILKHIFTEEDAGIALQMSFRPETAETILNRMNGEDWSAEELESKLDTLFKKGGIHSKVMNGTRYFGLAPLVVGMYELQNKRLTPEFIKNFRAYTRDKLFGIEFISTEIPQMRTIPISESVTSGHRVSPYDEVEQIISKANEPFAILECICRKKKEIEGEECKKTKRKDTCLAMGDMGAGAIHIGIGRQITREEALSIMKENMNEGLVLQPANTREAEFICSCCGCCCGILDMHHTLPKPVDFWATNFHAVVDPSTCNGCGVCEKRCQVGAVKVPIQRKKMAAVIDLNLCLGCGVCVPTCPKTAMSLEKNKHEITPPEHMEELYDIIMEKKKGPVAKMKVTGKIVIDAIRSGRLDSISLIKR